MPRGGKREGAGRKKAAVITQALEIAAEELEAGVTPLEVMLRTMRLLWKSQRCVEAAAIAKAAAPYVHPRLNAVEHTGRDGDALVPGRIEIVFVGGEDAG